MPDGDPPNITGNPGGGVARGWHFQSRHSFSALKGRIRRQVDLVAIQMLGRHVGVVHRHTEKNSSRKNVLGLGPGDHRLAGGQHPIHFEGIDDPDVGDVPFGQVEQPHWESSFLFCQAPGENILVSRVDCFANLALFDFAGFSELAGRRVVAGAEGARKRGRR